MVPVSFLVENQAVSKAVIKKGDLSTKLIVHVSNRKTVLSVVSNGSVHFTSTVNIGSEDFTSAIMKEFNVTKEEAERMKTEKGFLKNVDASDKSQTTIFLSLINTASALKDEIDRIILYWQSYVSKHSSNNDGSIDTILLSGRDALINGFKEYLRATIRLQVDTANVWFNIYDLDEKIPNIDYIDSLDYAVAIGLGLPRIGGNSH
jgi:Tfp pilus assembly PilM family ATPase